MTEPTAGRLRPLPPPLDVEVEDGLVRSVTAIDEMPVENPTVVEGDADYLEEAVKAADDGQPWPSWQFGH
jgi:hypothetical protein